MNATGDADEPLPAAFVQSVVEHMNTEHADAVCNIARHFGSLGNVSSARMEWLDRESMTMTATGDDGTVKTVIALDRRIEKPADVRPILIKMARQAREAGWP